MIRKFIRYNGKLYRLFDVKSQFQMLVEQKLKEQGWSDADIKKFFARCGEESKKFEQAKKSGVRAERYVEQVVRKFGEFNIFYKKS